MILPPSQRRPDTLPPASITILSTLWIQVLSRSRETDSTWIHNVEVIIAADDMGDTHVPVVHDDRKVVGGRPIRTQDNEVIQFFVVEHHPALHLVVNDNVTFRRIPEADNGSHAVLWLCALPLSASSAGAGPFCGSSPARSR